MSIDRQRDICYNIVTTKKGMTDMKNQEKTVSTNQFVNFVDLIYNFNEEVKGFNLETKYGEYYSEIMNINNKDVFIMIPEDDGIPYIVAFDDYFFDLQRKI